MNSRRFLIIACTSVLLTVSSPWAAVEVAGGFILGEPTGFSLRIEKFPVLSFGWSLTHDWMYVNCDYWIINKLIPDSRDLYWYLGVGGAIGAGGSHGFLGCRVPIGLQAILERRFELFGELAPGIGIMPDVNMFLNGGIGFRYIF
jgi:hypothetical protein